LIIAIGITALVGILTVVSALETISSDFASMGSNTFNVKQYENTTQRQGGEERKIINPIVSYTEAVDFKDEYDYPLRKHLLYGHF
jgi:putative ABC transport system permease protein